MFNIKNYSIPTRSGCYLYKDNDGKVIYVGKAKKLNNRVRSYFTNKSLDPKTKLLVSKIRDIEFITTNNELEALLLEQSLIHKYQPKFNINLKGTLRYAYIKITEEKFPRIITSRKADGSGEFFGPYTDGSSRREIITTLIKLFKIRTCVKLPKKVCLQYHLGNCYAPCVENISETEYMININNAKRILKGNTNGLIAELKGLMLKASKLKKFEIAKMYRDQINAITKVNNSQNIDQIKNNNQDYINWIKKDNKIYFQIFNVLKGVITSRHKFHFDYYEGIIEDFIRHYYSINSIPQEIVVPKILNNVKLLQEYLKELSKKKFALHYTPKIKITFPKKGTKKELLNLVKDNIEINFGLEPGILELKNVLHLKSDPVIIDFFDISNLKNKHIVGASIRLVNGQFQKNKYRKFKITSTNTQDDFISMQESVFRRYRDALKKKEELPDLICIDGGRGQLNSAVQALTKLELDISVCSIAKKEEEIYLPDTSIPIRLNKKLPGINILIKGRNEVHRFVLSFNRKLRKDIFESKNE